MSNYKRYKIEADNLDIRVKNINNFFSAYSLASDSQLLIGQMLETIRSSSKDLNRTNDARLRKWYKRDKIALIPPNWFTDKQDPEATRRLIEISEELRNKK